MRPPDGSDMHNSHSLCVDPLGRHLDWLRTSHTLVGTTLTAEAEIHLEGVGEGR